ncbi:hypothetical protein [Streptomyces sp. NBC_01176]|uniref:hypothetical protein n=1 Tax=Streptomyces sp. NBC_01176 TaxID=2903760 RepID=UPI00386ED7C9|nr:hypothetical protein OG199_16915 [Streptomyces sp. NBC_01176]
MEQRIGSKSQPLDAAAVNPAYIPGLTSPATAEPKDAVVEEAVSEEAAVEDVAPEEEVSAETPTKSEEEADSEPEPELDPDGPVFEASDRRASIKADHRGVRLRLDDQEAEFRWDEIGAVETESPRFGKRFTVTVHTPDRRWYPIEIEATARSRFKEWEEQLDAVLDAYFEEGAPEEDAPEEDAPDGDAPEGNTPDGDAPVKDTSAKGASASGVQGVRTEDVPDEDTP